MRRRSWCVGLLGLLGLSACTSVGPLDVPKAAPVEFRDDVVAAWPGASKVLATQDLTGEDLLRQGDRLLFGLELVNGDVVTRRLLQVEVDRGSPMGSRGSAWFRPAAADGAEPAERVRRVRPVGLAFVLYDQDGVELRRSAGKQIPDWALETGFVDEIRTTTTGNALAQAMASIRLQWVVQLFNEDPILAELLREVASIPLDLRLLFRRDLRLVPAFDQGREVVVPAGWTERLGPHFELPFDLLLNDSVFVRLSATVIAPRGPTGTAAGIVGLHAQQATDPSRRIRLQLLACARGPQNEWQQHGMLARCGWTDEGCALAFAPTGGRMVTPGALGRAELRDLGRADPNSAAVLSGAPAPVADLAFVDADTVLVARGSAIEVFAVAGVEPGQVLAPVATVPLPRRPVALLAANGRACFVGCLGGEVLHLMFAEGEALPRLETVRPALATTAKIGAAPAAPVALDPGRDFLRTAGDGGVDVQWYAETARYRRSSAGTWRKEAVDAESSARPGFLSKRGGRIDGLDGVSAGQGGSVKEPGADTFRPMMSICWGNSGHSPGHMFPCDDDLEAITHGFDPSGRFYAYVEPGYRLLVDVDRLRASFKTDAAAR